MLALSLSLGFAAPDASDVRARIEVDATDTASGTLGVRMRWTGLKPGPVVFRSLGPPAFHALTAVTFSTPEGPLSVQSQPSVFQVDAQGDVEVSYTVTPGGLGRHGHQGFVADEWAVFDGRIFLVPVGGVSPHSISMQFTLPEGWTAATPWPEKDGVYTVASAGIGADQLLEGSCVGLGRLDLSQGGTGRPLRIALPTAWEDKAVLQENTERIHQWYVDRLGFEGPEPFSVVWTPAAAEPGIYGGAFSNGTCFERPTGKAIRNWELLAHRYAHAMNRYRPTGMQIRDFRDRWFEEGLASWLEIRATSAVGIVPDESRWNILLRRHFHLRARHSDYRVALADEPTVSDPEMVEYVHYTLAPLVVRLLEARMAERSGVALEDFVRHLHDTYGNHQAPLPLREALEAFTGDSYDDFWALHVDQVTGIPPVWAEAVPEPRTTSTVVATAAGRPVSEALLRTMAQSGDFVRYSAMRDFLVEASLRLADLERRGLSVVPDAIGVQHLSLSGPAQYGLLQAVMGMQMSALRPPSSRGCSGPDPLPAPTFEVAAGHPVGPIFAALLDMEVPDEVRATAAGLDRMGVRRDSMGETPMPEVLTFSDIDEVVLFSQWGVPPGTAQFEVVHNQSVVIDKALAFDPTWRRSFTALPAAPRPKGDQLLIVRVSDADGIVGQRGFWQHRSE